MPVLAKAARNDGGAQDDECNQSDCHDSREPDEVFDVLEQVVFCASCRRELRAKLRNALGYPGLVRGTMIEVTGTCDGGHREAVLSQLAKTGVGIVDQPGSIPFWICDERDVASNTSNETKRKPRIPLFADAMNSKRSPLPYRHDTPSINRAVMKHTGRKLASSAR